MISVSMILALAFGFTLLGTVVFTIRQIITAPTGFEDENGFQATPNAHAFSSTESDRSSKIPTHAIAGFREVALHR